MKFSKSIFGIVLIFLIMGFLNCGKKIDLEAEGQSMKNLILRTAIAIQEQNWGDLQDLITDDWTFFTNRGDSWNLNEMRDYFKAHISDYNMKISEMQTHISSYGDMGWATFREQGEMLFQGKPVHTNALLTAVFIMHQDGWKMVHLHRSAPLPPQARAESE
jgi:ketosteroid isomerase-like protein